MLRERHIGFVSREPGYERVLPAGADPKTIVDVGALYDSTSWLRERFPAARIIATNVMKEHLDSIPDGWAQKVFGPAEQLGGFGQGDLVFLGEVLEHLVYPQEFLARAVELMPIGGLILLSTPNLTTWHNRALVALGYSPEQLLDDPRPAPRGPPAVEDRRPWLRRPCSRLQLPRAPRAVQSAAVGACRDDGTLGRRAGAAVPPPTSRGEPRAATVGARDRLRLRPPHLQADGPSHLDGLYRDGHASQPEHLPTGSALAASSRSRDPR